MRVKINKVDLDLVTADIQTNGPITKFFNTSFHAESDLPEGHDLKVPSETPYLYKRWLPVLMGTRRLPANEVEKISLTRPQAQLIVDAAAVSIITRNFSRPHREDFLDVLFPAFMAMYFGDQGRYLRLNACSPKDGVRTEPGQGNMSLHAVSDVILRLTSSKRARNAIIKELADGHDKIELYTLPYNHRFSPATEYRVFCCPGTGRITAVSQYRWTDKWRLADPELGLGEEERRKVVRKIMRGIDGVHISIMKDLKLDGSNKNDELLLEQGFTFDVGFDEDKNENPNADVALIELNVFGATSACGSCLFHWIEDMDLLYGRIKDIEFRVTF